MCDYFFQVSDQGDLADIVRAGGRASGPSDFPGPTWPLTSTEEASTHGISNIDHFGDPFIALRDPLMVEEFTGVELFDGGKRRVEAEEEVRRPPCDGVFGPRVMQISPGVSGKVAPPAVNAGEMMKVSSEHVGGQISSPRNAGIKRR